MAILINGKCFGECKIIHSHDYDYDPIIIRNFNTNQFIFEVKDAQVTYYLVRTRAKLIWYKINYKSLFKVLSTTKMSQWLFKTNNKSYTQFQGFGGNDIQKLRKMSHFEL